MAYIFHYIFEYEIMKYCLNYFNIVFFQANLFTNIGPIYNIILYNVTYAIYVRLKSDVLMMYLCSVY